VQYLKISNRGTVNRKFLELIGLSSKRDKMHDLSVIGFKGSGTKLAAVAALRLGLKVAIASSDHFGRYLLSYDVEEVDIGGGQMVKQIVFNYDPYGTRDGAEYALRYPSQMTIDAFADWDEAIGDDDKDAFKVLREFVCNASDSGEYDFALADQPECAEEGRTVVYLLYTDKVQAVFRNPERYFKFVYAKKPAEPLFADAAIGEIYPRSDSLRTRLFVLGVLVDCTSYSWRSSIFDYSLFKKTLISEERVIKSYHEYTAELGKLFGALTDSALAARILLSVEQRQGMIEESALGSVSKVSASARPAWLEAAAAVFGPKIAVASGNQQIDNDAHQVYGYHIIARGNISLAHFLRKVGVPDAKLIVPAVVEESEYRLVRYDGLDEASRERFQLAFRLFAGYFPESARLPIVLYEPLSERLKACAGFAGSGTECFEEIWIAAVSATELTSVDSLLRTLVHEARHCQTRAGDYERPFVNKADEEIARIILAEAGLPGFTGFRPPAADAPSPRPNLADPARVSRRHLH
jgi:hypothetical protein